MVKNRDKTTLHLCLHSFNSLPVTFSLTTHLCPSCSSSSTEGMGMLLLLHTFSCCNVGPSHVLQHKLFLEWALHQVQFLVYQPASTGPPLLWCLDTSILFLPAPGVFTVLSLHFLSALRCFGCFLNVLSLDEPPAWLLGSALCLCLALGQLLPSQREHCTLHIDKTWT